MKRDSHTIHDNKGCVFDCACVVDITMDGETVGLEFPQLAQEGDNIGPMAYVSMDWTKLKVSLTDRNDVQISFTWDEKGSRWIQWDNVCWAQLNRKMPNSCSDLSALPQVRQRLCTVTI